MCLVEKKYHEKVENNKTKPPENVVTKADLSITTDVSKISPHILWSGLKSALATTFSGGFVLLFSTFSWYFFSIKHKPQA